MNEKQEIERSHKSLSENVSLKEEAGSPIISALENIHSASYYCDLHTDTYQVIKQPAEMEAYIPVSYTHLDVYKRQVLLVPQLSNMKLIIGRSWMTKG